ncbi:hypothetical protein KEM54_005489 [Ascosphaera aggregata]|nr:hypothetical protein KEM54_005489 [Ascosphaera aggregata]
MSIRPAIDRLSGQVYTDQRIRATPSNLDCHHHHGYIQTGRSWAHERPILPIGWGEEGSGGAGANSLKYIAMRHVLADQRRVTRAHVEAMGWPLAKYLWEKLGEWSFYDLSNHHCMTISDLRMPFTEYIADITDEDDADAKCEMGMRWGVVLTLATDFVRFPELLNLSKIGNMVALEVETQTLPNQHLSRRVVVEKENREEEEEVVVEDNQRKRQQQQVTAVVTPVQVTDRVVRSWSELARTGTAFQHLRILKLRLQRGVSEHVFSYLHLFPSLVGFAAVECPGIQTERAKEVAEKNGWSVYDSRKRTQTCKTVYEMLMDHMGSLAEDEEDEKSVGKKGIIRLKRTPLLEFAIELPLFEKMKTQADIRLFTRDLSKAAPRNVNGGDESDRGKKRRMSSVEFGGDGHDVDYHHDIRKPRRRRPIMRANSRIQKEVFNFFAELQE